MQSVLPIEITQAVCEDHIKAIAEGLGANKSWVYRICSDPEHDYLTRFLAFLDAVQAVNPEGAAILVDYIRSHHLSKTTKGLVTDRNAALQDAITVLAEAVGARSDNARLRLRAAQVITAMESIIRGDI